MSKDTVIVIGGGFAGCGAAIAVAKTGAKVVLLERTDMLLAGGNRAGHTNSAGRWIQNEELKAMGGGDILQALEGIILHRLQGKELEHGYIYNCALVEPAIRKVVMSHKIDVRFKSRAVDVVKKAGRLEAVRMADGELIEGGAFVDCTGTTGGMDICKRYGAGCVMCGSFRCPVFGNRVSIATKAGAKELSQRRADGTRGLLGLAVCVSKASLSRALREELELKGHIKIPLPRELVDYKKANSMANISSKEEAQNINLSDIGSMAKCSKMGYMSVDDLRRIPGFETAMIEDPMGAGVFTFVKEVSIHHRDNALKVAGFDNLFVGGEKIGPIGGVDTSMLAGIFAGYNAARLIAGVEPLIMPNSTAIGDYIDFTGRLNRTQEGLNQLCRPGQGLYLERMVRLGLYPQELDAIHQKIDDLNLTGVLAQKLN